MCISSHMVITIASPTSLLSDTKKLLVTLMFCTGAFIPLYCCPNTETPVFLYSSNELLLIANNRPACGVPEGIPFTSLALLSSPPTDEMRTPS